MSAPPYMKLYVADYFGDTHHLGALEHGAYLTLLMSMWRAGGSLPANDANLARMARCSPDEWASIKATIMAFFKVSRGRVTNKRLAQEIAKYENTSGKRSEAGKRGGAKKPNENKPPSEAIASNLLSKTEAIADITRTRTKDSSEDKSSALSASPSDLNALTWQLANVLLRSQGSMTDKASGAFFGKLLSVNGLDAKDLLPAVSAATLNGTTDPQGYLTKSAASLASRRLDAAPKRVAFV